MEWVFKIIGFGIWLFAGGIAVMANIRPAEAASNLKAWLEVFGIQGIGETWTSATDERVTWVAGAVLVCGLLWNFGAPLWARLATGEGVSSATYGRRDTAPVSATWIPRNEAARILRRSSLVRLRLPSETITGIEALGRTLGLPSTQTPSEVRADELTRKLLRDFEAQHPTGVRNGQYGKELMEWWIDEQADRMDP